MVPAARIVLPRAPRPAMSRRDTLLGGSLLVAVALAGCAGPGADLPPIPSPDATAYILGPGDQVRIITFGEEQLTGEFRVDASGNIALPLIGDVRAAGLTSRQLEAALVGALESAKLFKDPSVSVEVVTYRPFFVLGEVSRPGQYPYQPGMSVVTAVAVAGGFTYRAIERRFSIVRDVNGHPVEGRAGRQTPVEPGDVITVFERVF